MRLNKQQIEKKASRGGSSGCSVDFLKSEEVAEKVADALWQNLRKTIKNLERRFVKVMPSIDYPGTWRVRYLCVPMASLAPSAKTINARRGEAMKQAAKASYSSDDLVDSWTS